MKKIKLGQVRIGSLFPAMTNSLRVLPEPTRILEEGEARKFLLPVSGDGGRIYESESVIVPMTGYRGNRWYTVCVSSQIGCRLGCTFCETGKMGLIRQLSAEEIVVQRIVAGKLMRDLAPIPQEELVLTSKLRLKKPPYDADGIRGVVFMGMGEPLDNYDEVVRAIRIMSDPRGLSIPLARITISTAGHVEGIRRLACLGWKSLRIAVSLNAADDRLRDELMPVNRTAPLSELKKALLEYPLSSRGRFLIEYVLIGGVNDSSADAKAVGRWCQNLPCLVNVIPYNPQSEGAYESPSSEEVRRFMSLLSDEGLFVKRRKVQGRDLMAACGQLGDRNARTSHLMPAPT